MSGIQVLIIEDEPLIAEDIKDYLNEMDFKVAGIAHSSAEALDMLANRSIDLAIIDIYIQGSQDGIEVAEIIRDTYHIPFIFLTSMSDRGTIERAKRTFPYGYVVKPFDERDLLTNLEMALHKHANENRSLLLSLDEINMGLDSPITPREYEIALDISHGMINRQIAVKQYVSVNTIKTHIKNLYSKLDVHTRGALIHKLAGNTKLM